MSQGPAPLATGGRPATETPAAGRSAGGGGIDGARLVSLLAEARAGNRDSVGEIVSTLTPLLWQVARAQGLDRDTAEDVVQTTWLALLRHLHGIHTPAALTGWLITVTKREAWRAARARRYERPVEDWPVDRVCDPAPTPDTEVVMADCRNRLWALVRALPVRCQQLLRIVAVTPRPDYAAISAALGMPHGSLGPTRGRCLAKLRRLIDTDPTWSS
ncbi:MAG: sigma-70 family RNA polymerase sigma factor [Actinobacteria bacterium]|nr:sigma-70 family RNA polymerase sigma factor [Actinomycetota bacterium]MBI3687597.1 sigma-70 family RNA polymerase sigma factor [Actinomycetota bacterium]